MPIWVTLIARPSFIFRNDFIVLSFFILNLVSFTRNILDDDFIIFGACKIPVEDSRQLTDKICIAAVVGSSDSVCANYNSEIPIQSRR